MKIVKSISLDEKYWKMLQKIAEDDNRNISNMIEVLIKKYKEEREK